MGANNEQSVDTVCDGRGSALCAVTLEQFMGARHRVGTELSYRPASQFSLAESIPWHRFLGALKV